MSDHAWSSLAAPYQLDSVRWHAIDRSSDGLRVRLAPHLAPEALRARFDEAAGPDAWSLTLTAWGEDALIAELTLLNARGATGSRAVVSRALKVPSLAGPDGAGSVSAADAATGAAWTAAAAAFGAAVPVVVLDDGWVDADPDSGEGLHVPEHVASPQAQSGAHRGSHDGADAPQAPSRTPSQAAPSIPASPSTAELATDARRDETERAGDAAKPDGHQVIDRLVERLRQEGLGADAARLVTSYGGYGGDPEASRELYAKLRALLVQRSART